MKRLFLLFFIVASGSLFGQSHFIGIQTGINTSSAFDAVQEELRFNAKPFGGITYEFVSSRNFIFDSELLFYPIGFYIESQGTNENMTEVGSEQMFLSYNYLSLPLKFGYKLGSDFYYSLKLGIAPSYLLEASHNISDDSSNKTMPSLLKKSMLINPEIANNEDKAGKFDIAALAEFGLGYEFKNRINLGLNIGFRQSLLELSNADYFPEKHLLLYGFLCSLEAKYRL